MIGPSQEPVISRYIAGRLAAENRIQGRIRYDLHRDYKTGFLAVGPLTIGLMLVEIGLYSARANHWDVDTKPGNLRSHTFRAAHHAMLRSGIDRVLRHGQ